MHAIDMLSSVVPREFAYSIISTHFTILFVCCSILRRDNSVMFTFFVNFLFILVICLFNATLLQRDIMQIYWSQQSVYTPLNVLGVTACLFLTLEMIHPPLLCSTHSDWLDLPRHAFFPCCIGQPHPPLTLKVCMIGWLACDAATFLLEAV